MFSLSIIMIMENLHYVLTPINNHKIIITDSQSHHDFKTTVVDL